MGLIHGSRRACLKRCPLFTWAGYGSRTMSVVANTATQKGRRFRDSVIRCGASVMTASDVIPWPMPDGMDFASFHTLRILHGGREKFGPIAADYSLRPKDYHAALP